MTLIQARAANMANAGAAPAVISSPVRWHRAGRMLALVDATAAVVTVAVAVGVVGSVTRGAIALLFVPLWVGAVAASGEYHLPGGLRVRGRRLVLVTLMLPTAALLATELISYPMSALTVTTVCLGTAALGTLTRGVIVTAGRRGFRVSGMMHRVVVAGTAGGLPRLLDRLDHLGPGRFAVVGLCVADGQPVGCDGLDLVHGLDACAASARTWSADTVILVPDPTITPSEVRRLRWTLEETGIATFVWTGLFSSPIGRTRLDLSGDFPLLHLSAPRRMGPSYAVKRAVDPLIALAVLVLLAPLLLVLVVAIRRDSPGPAFFRQTRVGKDDSRFTMWKLRTMTCDADAARCDLEGANEASGPLFKIRADPRVTRVGRWLRSTSLDELPQLINVVLGQMSLVGPRPALPAEVERYDPDVRHRLVVHPGITGLWQVSGRSDLSWEDGVRLDEHYVDDWSLLLDLRILLRTVGAVLRSRGAY